MRSHKGSKVKPALPPAASGSFSIGLKAAAALTVCFGVIAYVYSEADTEEATNVSAVADPAPDHNIAAKQNAAVANEPVQALAQATPALSGTVATAPTPRGLTDAQWQMLTAEFKDHPQRDAQIKRVVDFMAFGATLNELQELVKSGGGHRTEAIALAQEVNNALPDRLTQGEIMAGEALTIKAIVLEVLEINPAKRQLLLDQWKKTQLAQSQSPPDPRETEFLRQQDLLAAAWQAQPEASRDPKKLEADLNALRARIFDGSGRQQ